MRIVTEKDTSIREIVANLQRGEIIVYPTETCYGLGCDATNRDAVQKIFRIKGRDDKKSMLVLMADMEMATQYVVRNNRLKDLAKEYWPGPLTIVTSVRAGTDIAPELYPQGELAIRISNHPLASKIVRELGRPLVSTSANMAGGPNPYDIPAVMADIGQQSILPDILIDAGPLPERLPSTIVRVTGNSCELIRQGELDVTNIISP